MKSLPIRILLAVLAAGATAAALSSCHTTAGLGADMQDAGRGMQRAAHRAHSH